MNHGTLVFGFQMKFLLRFFDPKKKHFSGDTLYNLELYDSEVALLCCVVIAVTVLAGPLLSNERFIGYNINEGVVCRSGPTLGFITRL